MSLSGNWCGTVSGCVGRNCNSGSRDADHGTRITGTPAPWLCPILIAEDLPLPDSNGSCFVSRLYSSDQFLNFVVRIPS